MENRFRKLAQTRPNFHEFLTGDPESVKKPDPPGWKKLKQVLRYCYESSKLVPEWVLPDKWTEELAGTVRKMYEEAVSYNEKYRIEMMTGDQDKQPNLPQQNRQEKVNDRAKPLLERIENIYKAQ